jgi:transcriptional regulator with XRE-family HTH domain
MALRFKRLREAAGITQLALAERAGLPLGTVRNWEQGLRIPRFDHAIRVADALGISLDELAGREEGPPPAPEPKRRRKK